MLMLLMSIGVEGLVKLMMFSFVFMELVMKSCLVSELYEMIFVELVFLVLFEKLVSNCSCSLLDEVGVV